jgi:uncharacterized membrane protein YdjX (TVP38/TMEM64 family)
MAENRWKKLILAGLLLSVPGLALGLAKLSGLSANDLLASRDMLRTYAQAHEIMALSAYVAAYAAAVALSVPGALVLTLMGGFLFGAIKGGLAAVLGASLGASLLFLLARGILRDFFRKGAEGMAAKMARKFEENAFSYLLFLRIVPVFPFFLVNIAPAFCRISFPIFAAATFLGILPATFAIASIGAGLDEVLARAGAEGLQPANLLTPRLWVGLCILGFLSLLPVAYNRLTQARAQRKAGGQ